MQKLIAVIGVFIVVALLFGGGCISYNNKSQRLRNLASAKQDESKVIFDKTWKTVKAQAGIAEKYTETLKDIVLGTMQGRYGANGSKALAQFIHEQNPNIDSSIFTKIMTTVEANNAEFLAAQKDLIGVKNSHSDLITTFPGSLLVMDKTPIKIQLVTSERTDNAFQTGQDNDVNPFGSKK